MAPLNPFKTDYKCRQRDSSLMLGMTNLKESPVLRKEGF